MTGHPTGINAGTTRRQLIGAAAAWPALAWSQTASDRNFDRLDKDLTPMGAERSGNRSGSIPGWNGGIATPPADFERQKGWADPFAADKPLFTIHRDNLAQHADLLVPGQRALLQRSATYRMVVYPSRRSAGYPNAVYQGIRAEAADARLDNDGNAVKDVRKSHVPFPLPTRGVEVMWNSVFRYRGSSFTRHVADFPVQAVGAFTPVRRTEDWIFGTALMPPVPNLLIAFRTRFNEPSHLAGEVILVHELIDQVRQPRQAWLYNPGSRRVMRVPELSHDYPRQGSEGLSTVDDYDGFAGSPDRFDWRLVGKREMLISYNNHRLSDKSLKYRDIVRPDCLEPALLRYELHRVWVVEGILKPGMRHVYGRRVFYIDEDSWQVAHSDQYDMRGQLWRVLEQHAMQFYDAPCLWMAGSAQYDLQARRYIVCNLGNEEPPLQFDAPLSAGDFTPDALRRTGR
jgi:hypothetical protein